MSKQARPVFALAILAVALALWVGASEAAATRGVPWLGAAPGSVGSDGSDGALIVEPGEARVVDLAVEGTYDPVHWCVVFQYTDVHVKTDGLSHGTVTFLNHPTRAPVVWLVQNDVLIDGVVSLVGGDGQNTLTPGGVHADPGPGGFRGGRNCEFGPLKASSAGFGPGGGFLLPNQGLPSEQVHGGNGGSHAEQGTLGGLGSIHDPANNAPTYGSAGVFPLVGGSGGSAGLGVGVDGSNARSDGGGAGGGALLIAADGVIDVSGTLDASGGDGGETTGPIGPAQHGGGGAGGALRLRGSSVFVRAGADVRVLGGVGPGFFLGWHAGDGGAGRIRLEAPAGQVVLETATAPMPSVGLPQDVFPASAPTIEITSVGAFAAPADPQAVLLPGMNSADVELVDGALTQVVVQAQGIPDGVDVELRVTKGANSEDGGAQTSTQPLVSGLAVFVVDLHDGYSALQARAVLD